MGKVKSAIITAILVAAVLVLALFATVSCNVPGSNGVKRYNSFISSIHLGSDFTGEAYTMLYPEGVLSTADYELVALDKDNADSKEYAEKYVPHGGLYVDKDKLGDNEAEFKASVLKDAKILAKRFGGRGYSSNAVSVEDDYSIRVSVPTNFSYAAYTRNDATARSEELSKVSHTVQYLMLSGGLSLRNGSDFDDSKSLISVKDDICSYIKSVSKYSMGGQHAVKIKLTDDGFKKLNAVITASSEEGTAYFFIGETNLNLTVTTGSDKALEQKTIYYSSEKSYALDYAILLKSVVKGDTLTNAYNEASENSATGVAPATPAFGEHAAIWLLVSAVCVLAAAVAASIVKYKKLGLINALMSVVYTLVIVTVAMLTGLQITLAGAVVAALGLALLTFSNFRTFEAVRRETTTGRTIQASVKLGYKKTLTTVLDLHIILLVAAIMFALIGAGEIASCGLIFFVATIASYILYWFTRFMWFVNSTPVRDKFAFCGFEREAFDDED